MVYNYHLFLILNWGLFECYSGDFSNAVYNCRDNNIHVKRFLHTSTQTPAYLRAAAKSALAKKELQKLFDFLKDNRDVMGINVGSVQLEGYSNIWELSEDLSITILSPSNKELDQFIKGVKYTSMEEGANDNPQANWLSTVLKIQTPRGYALLTSDAVKTSLVRIDKKLPEELSSILMVGQSPHHGAFGNHNNTFWKKRNRQSASSVVFSVGSNHYGHPANQVVDFFRSEQFGIYSTNNIGGLDLLKQTSEAKKSSSMLDMYSIVDDNTTSDLQGDKIFIL